MVGDDEDEDQDQPSVPTAMEVDEPPIVVPETPIVVDEPVQVEATRPVSLQCHWRDCQLVFQSTDADQEVYDHVLKDHLKTSQVFECRWKNCVRFSPSAGSAYAPSLPPLIAHFKTHRPYLNRSPASSTSVSPHPTGTNTTITTVSKPSNTPTSATPTIHHQPHTNVATGAPVPLQQDVSSIPLTAALILRNIARTKENVALFAPYESEIAMMVTSPGHHEAVIRTVASILREIARADGGEEETSGGLVRPIVI